MSYWSYVHGLIEVIPIGQTQAEKRYVLDTVLAHLPVIYGSEGPMQITVVEKEGHDISSWTDELGNIRTDQMQWYHTNEVQSAYLLVLSGDLRDRESIEDEFRSWLDILSGRIYVRNVLVAVTGHNGGVIISDDCTDKFVMPSWVEDGSRNWCEDNTWVPEVKR